ncbi:MAG: recombinase family protein [Nitrospira sp.]|nr:recombinase family protein [Nitrospira sp.]
MKRVAIYGRVSTTGQSTDVQIQECRAYAERCGYQVVGEYCDKISGTTSKDDREALTRLLEDAFARKFDTVVVYSIDRLGRSLKHCLEILETLKMHRIDFISIKQQIDTSSHHGLLIFNIFASLASFERSQILERTALGRERAKARGVRFGRPSKMNSSVAEAVRLLRQKGSGIKEIAKSLQIGVGSVYKALRTAA